MQQIQISASRVVRQVLAKGKTLNQVLDDTLNSKIVWLPGQRAALQDLSYGTLRYYGQLQALLALLLHKPLHDEAARYLLLVALYQLMYGKSAQHAVVDHAVRSAQSINPSVGGLVNAILRNFLRNRDNLISQTEESPEGKYSYPCWWIDWLRDQYGERSTALLEAGNQHPPMTLRVNQRRITAPDYIELLDRNDIAANLIGPVAVKLEKPVPVDKLPGFHDGLVSVQDAGAQHAARLLDIRDGMRVLDACAAPGGKTAHILELAEVEMLALDKNVLRMRRVAENIQRLGLTARLDVGDAAKPEKWWDGKLFQRILADVPCSASGVVRRHPDIKWLRRSVDIAGFARQQLEILCALWRLLEQDGKLLYVTCSLFRQENSEVVSHFLEQHRDAVLLPVSFPENEAGQLLPDENHDGFFYALLQKRSTEAR